MSWEKTLVPLSATMHDAVEVLGASVMHVCLVVDDARRLKGTITDGDVRRGLLRGLSLTTSVIEIMNNSPHSISTESSRDEMLSLLREYSLRHLPIVDSSGVVVGLTVLEDLFPQPTVHPNWVVLLAGGLGHRLKPLTDHMPKPLVKIGDKPVLELIIERFVSQGFRRFYLSVNYKADMIKAACGDGARWGAIIRYLDEDTALGTAGPLGLIDQLPDDPLIVMNADLITTIDYRRILDFHREHGSMATMAVREFEMQVPFGVVQLDGAYATAIEEKPMYSFFVNAGIYVIDPSALSQIERGKPLDMPDFFKRLFEGKNPVTAYPVSEYWLDVGRHDDLKRANADYEHGFARGQN